jgi:hypothetical protein
VCVKEKKKSSSIYSANNVFGRSISPMWTREAMCYELKLIFFI